MRRGHRRAVLALALVNVLVLAAGVGAAIADIPGARVAPHLVEREPVSAKPVLRPLSTRPVAAVSGGTARADVKAAYAAATRSPPLGSSVAGLVVDPTSGATVLGRRADVPAAPASTTKLLTAASALAAIGPDARLTTEVVRHRGAVVLVGGGDPTLASPEARQGYPESARIGELAERTASALRASGDRSVRLRYDTSLFTGSDTASTWDRYVASGYVAPVTALMVDGGRVRPDNGIADHNGDPRVSDPPEAAARLFAELLEQHGITVRDSVSPQDTPPEAHRLAAVRSPPIGALVEQMLETSDNTIAEMLGRQVAVAADRPASFRGAATAVEQTLGKLGVPTRDVRLHDCSGLSHQDTATARALAHVLSLAASPDHPALRSILSGLPVAGYSGTLSDRYEHGSAERAAGLVRAKTGTLNEVSTLAGVAYRPGGRILVFAFLADHVPLGANDAAEAALDRLAAGLAGREGG